MQMFLISLLILIPVILFYLYYKNFSDIKSKSKKNLVLYGNLFRNVFDNSNNATTDITESRKEEQELQDYRIKLEQIIEEKTRNLEQTNHELQALNEELYATTEELENKNTALKDEIEGHKKTQAEREEYRIQLETLLNEKTEYLEQLSERFKEVYTYSSDAIVFMDVFEEGKVIKVFDMNQVSRKLFKISDDQIVQGITIKDLLPEIKIESFISQILPQVLAGNPVTFTDEKDTGNGYWNSTIYPIKNKRGEVYRIAAFSRNVTAEHEREELTVILQSAVDSWPFEFWARDIEGYEIVQNRISREKSGDLIGTNLADLELPIDKRNRVNELTKRVLSGEYISEDKELTENGKTRHVVYKLSPIFDKGKIIGYTGIVIDITERKEAEGQIKQSEEKYRLLAENIGDVIWKMDINSRRFTYISPSIYNLTGYTVEESMQQTLDQILAPSSYEELIKELSNRIQMFYNGKHEAVRKTYRYELIHKKGYPVWVETNTSFITGDDGKIKEIIASSRDYTERHNMEMALRNSEERYNLVTKLSGYVVYDYDIEKQRVIWAGAVKDVLGYTPDELNENNFEKLLELIHPDDINLVKRKLVTEPDSIHSSKTQYRYLTKNKGYIWVETQAFLFTDDQNKQCRWLGIMRDITGQLHIDSLIKASEEKLRTIFDTSKDGILLLDRNLCVIDINQSALIKIGYSKEDIIGGKAKKFLHSDTSLLAQKLITDWANASIDNFETEVLTKDQSSFPVEINAATMRFNNQDVLLLMIRDITERKKLEKELLHSVINTEEMERLRFSQELHDGLGPLLSAAKLYTEWLAEPDSNIDPKTIIADIQKLLEESNKTVREISFKLSPHILQNYGIAEAINAYAEKAEKSGKVHISIKTSNFKRFDETIEAIIYRVICECINNTIKHAKAQNIAITLQLAENNICIDYKDDGIGFDINTLKLKQKGIGLLNMQSRLKSINGQISIQSAINNGIKISIKIPLGII